MVHSGCSRQTLSLFIRRNLEFCSPRTTTCVTPGCRHNFSTSTYTGYHAAAKESPRHNFTPNDYMPPPKTLDPPNQSARPDRINRFPGRTRTLIIKRGPSFPQNAPVAPVSTPAFKPPQRPTPNEKEEEEEEEGGAEDSGPPSRPEWQIQKAALRTKFGGAAWDPPKKLSPDTLDGIRYLHKTYPEQFTTPALAKHFEISPEAVRRILKSKWQPKPEEDEKRRLRWEKRGERAWTQMAEEQLMRPPKKWRERGIGTDVPRRPTVSQWAELEVKKLMDRRRAAKKESAVAASSTIETQPHAAEQAMQERQERRERREIQEMQELQETQEKHSRQGMQERQTRQQRPERQERPRTIIRRQRRDPPPTQMQGTRPHRTGRGRAKKNTNSRLHTITNTDTEPTYPRDVATLQTGSAIRPGPASHLPESESNYNNKTHYKPDHDYKPNPNYKPNYKSERNSASNSDSNSDFRINKSRPFTEQYPNPNRSQNRSGSGSGSRSMISKQTATGTGTGTGSRSIPRRSVSQRDEAFKPRPQARARVQDRGRVRAVPRAKAAPKVDVVRRLR